MSDKPRVYQGVRVKVTVRELLQKHRARKANKVKTIPQACADIKDLYAPTFQSNYVDPTTKDCCAELFQFRDTQFPAAASSCSIQLQESAFSAPQQQMHQQQQQFGLFPSNHYDNINNDSSCYNSSMHPSPAFLAPLGQGSDVDHYEQGMGPCSSPELLKLCSPVDQNSYSPQDSFSSSSSSCYDSPTRMESSFSNFTSEQLHFQNCTPHHCYCLSHYWPGQQENYAAPEYSTYYAPIDYSYACTVEENYLKNNFTQNTEMCYNVL